MLCQYMRIYSKWPLVDVGPHFIDSKAKMQWAWASAAQLYSAQTRIQAQSSSTWVHLSVYAAQYMQLPIWSPLCQVPSTVHPGKEALRHCRSRVLHKHPRCHFRTIHVALCQAAAAEAQLPGCPSGDKLPVLIHNVGLCVGDGPACQDGRSGIWKALDDC